MPLNVRSVADLNAAIVRNIHRLDRHSFDVVVGIPRSGMIAASIVATYLQKPLADVEGYRRGIISGRSGIIHTGPRDRVLLVDDTCNKGKAFERAVRAIEPLCSSTTRLAVFGPYQVERPEEICDVWLESCRGPRAFEWNLWKHKRLVRWAFDFDGVFCRDPTGEENDDGERYRRFLVDVEPLFLPVRPIGTIVTGRLEKWRPESERWLARHGVRHQGMIMMPYATKAERMEAGGRGQWKAGIARKLGVEMFVESSAKQAGIIAREAGIPVWCVETMSVVRSGA